ncbi:MAG: hypothetical protein HFE74_00195 [Firmicutes bacterium]|jgi:hypothetical protein|nr:hypothetical protein [Bacillota bacterium]
MELITAFDNLGFFSLFGLVVVIVVVIPNFVFAKKGRETKLDDIDTAGVMASFLEVVSRIGLTLALILMRFELRYDVMGICAGVALLIYFILWLRYFKNGCYYPDIYMKSFVGIPVPFDVFISLYFIFASLWLCNIVALGFSLVYAVSRLLNARAALKDLKTRPEE